MTKFSKEEFAQVRADSQEYLMNTYGRFPLAFVDGYDYTLIDQEGKEYTDFLAGIAVCSLGYSNKAFQKAVKEAAVQLTHTSNFFEIIPQVQLAKLLCQVSGASKVFFGNSGAEANEGAMKIARRRAYRKYGPDKHEIIGFRQAFHGRTLATLKVTDNEAYREGYGPLPEGFTILPFNDLEAIRQNISEKTAGVILEVVQGEGGVHVADPAFVQELRDLTQKYDCALIIDEIQSGMGRTGKLFAFEHYGIQPDIFTSAKALANGIPIGAILAYGDYAEVFTPGAHGTTFGGNHLATSAGLASLQENLRLDLSQRAAETGAYFKESLEKLQEKEGLIKKIRGLGLLIGAELNLEDGQPIVQAMLEKGFIINCTKGNVLRFIPPLIISKEAIDAMIEALADCLSSYSKKEL